MVHESSAGSTILRDLPSLIRIPRVALIVWILSGVCIIGFSVGTARLSTRFVYGVGHAERPIITFLLLYLIGWCGFACAAALARGGQGNRRLLIWVVVVGLAARVILIPSNLIQENDCYRYVLDGHAVLNSVNPYALAPADVGNKVSEPFRTELGTSAAKHILSRISYPEVSTIYPPVTQFFFAIGARLTPWDWMGQRLVFLGCDIATFIIILSLLKRTGTPLAFSLIYWWNPLVIKEIANSAHLDSLVAFFLVLTLWALMKGESEGRQSAWISVAGVSFAGAVLSKFYPLILAPIFGAYLLKRGKPVLHTSLFFLVAFAAIIISYLPFIDIGFSQVMSGLQTYTDEWVLNEGAFYLVSFASNHLLPVTTLPVDRIVANGVVAVFTLFMAWRYYNQSDTIENLFSTAQTILLIWFLFLPAVYPWYAVGLIAISALKPTGTVVVLSGVMGMYYLTFLISYRDYPANWNVVVQIIEHGIMWSWLIGAAVVCKFGHTRKVRGA